jgi:hypothetical protein
VKNEVVYPFLNNLVGIVLGQGLKVLDLALVQVPSSFHGRVNDLNHPSVLDDEFRFTLPVLAFGMNLNRFVFIGLEKNNDP